MNTNIDQQCHELADEARQFAINTTHGARFRASNIGAERVRYRADRIIALRTSELPALYHVVTVNDRTGAVTRMTATPVTHGEACVILGKLAPLSGHPHLRRTVILANAAQVAK